MLIISGDGLINTAINKLPFELHYPNYSYLGPGTKLEKRLRENSKPINKLDEAAREHDIFYRDHKDLKERHEADKVLEYRAWDRVRAKDASLGEKTAAWLTTNIMKVKRKIGAGHKRRRRRAVQKPKTLMALAKNVAKIQGNGLLQDGDLVSKAYKSLKIAKRLVKNTGGRNKIKAPRVIKLPKGGFLPLIPIFAALSAIGSLSGGAAGIAKAVNDAKAKEKLLNETQRHNQMLEAVAMGKKGSGLYLKKLKTGMGLYLWPPTKN